MDILFICRTDLNGIGGDVTCVKNLLAELEKMSDLNLVVVSRYDSYYKTNKQNNILLDYAKSIFKSVRYCLTRCDKNCIIYDRYSTFDYGVWLAKIFRKAYIVEFNGFIEEEVDTIYGNSIKYKIIKKIIVFNTKKACEIAKKVVVVTDKMKDRLAKEYNIPFDKIIVINNGADVHKFRPVKSDRGKEIKRVELELNPKCLYVCFVGQFYKWHGIDCLIQSAPLILKECSHTKFLIVGDGMMKEELINLAERTGVSANFIFTGAVPYEEVPTYINASDVCVAPFPNARNAKIGLSPIKLYEYAACGKPIVASNISGVGDLLEQQNAGISVEPGNPEELAKAIVGLLKDKKIRVEMGKNGREYVVKYHSWEVVAKRVADVCKSAVRKRK